MLPSAEIQLEKQEAEIREKGKEVIKTTPLLEYLKATRSKQVLFSFYNFKTIMLNKIIIDYETERWKIRKK